MVIGYRRTPLAFLVRYACCSDWCILPTFYGSRYGSCVFCPHLTCFACAALADSSATPRRAPGRLLPAWFCSDFWFTLLHSLPLPAVRFPRKKKKKKNIYLALHTIYILFWTPTFVPYQYTYFLHPVYSCSSHSRCFTSQFPSCCLTAMTWTHLHTAPTSYVHILLLPGSPGHTHVHLTPHTFHPTNAHFTCYWITCYSCLALLVVATTCSPASVCYNTCLCTPAFPPPPHTSFRCWFGRSCLSCILHLRLGGPLPVSLVAHHFHADSHTLVATFYHSSLSFVLTYYIFLLLPLFIYYTFHHLPLTFCHHFTGCVCPHFTLRILRFTHTARTTTPCICCSASPCRDTCTLPLRH